MEVEWNVTEGGIALRCLELDPYSIQRLEILSAAGRAERGVAVGKHTGELHAWGQGAGHGQIE